MKINFKKLLNEPIFEYQKFHEKIKNKKITKIKDDSKWPKTWKTVYFKGYPRFEEIILPKPKILPIKLKNVLLNRHSTREFSSKILSIEKISSLLYYSAGLRKKNVDQRGNRFYPSGGARYPLEVYILSLNTELPKGIYHYYLKTHSLEKILEFDDFSFREYFIYDKLKDPACLIIITASFDRSVVKYKDRGYMLSLIETGALMQNFYINAVANDLGICALGGFVDDKINQLLDLDGQMETSAITMVVGEKL